MARVQGHVLQVGSTGVFCSAFRFCSAEPWVLSQWDSSSKQPFMMTAMVENAEGTLFPQLIRLSDFLWPPPPPTPLYGHFLKEEAARVFRIKMLLKPWTQSSNRPQSHPQPHSQASFCRGMWRHFKNMSLGHPSPKFSKGFNSPPEIESLAPHSFVHSFIHSPPSGCSNVTSSGTASLVRFLSPHVPQSLPSSLLYFLPKHVSPSDIPNTS